MPIGFTRAALRALKKPAAKTSVHKKKPKNKRKTTQNKPKTTGSQVTEVTGRPNQNKRKVWASGVFNTKGQTENEPKTLKKPAAKPSVHKKKPNQNKPKTYQKPENKPKTYQNKPKTTGSQVTGRPYQAENEPKTSGSQVIGRPYQTENEPKRKVWTTGTKGKTMISDADSASATSDHSQILTAPTAATI